MPLQKQNVNLPFALGLDTKTDPFQETLGKFAALNNIVFSKQGLLQKRNGYANLTRLPTGQAKYLTTFDGNLTVVADSLQAYSTSAQSWINKGSIETLQLSVLPIYRSSLNQTQVDAAITPNGLMCCVFSDFDGTSTTYKYLIADSSTSQVLTPATSIPTTGAPRVFAVGNWFIIIFPAASNNLQSLAISSLNIGSTVGPTVVAVNYAPTADIGFDGVVYSSVLYLAWNATDNHLNTATIDAILRQYDGLEINTGAIVRLAMGIDSSIPSSPYLYISYTDSSNNIKVLVTDGNLILQSGSPVTVATVAVANMTVVANAAVGTVFYEIVDSWGSPSVPDHSISSVTCTQSGSPGTPSSVLLSVGLASKAFQITDSEGLVGVYFLASFGSVYQPSYFLVKSTGQVIAKLAYSNGVGYLTHGLPNVSVSGFSVKIPYLYADQIQAVSKEQGLSNPAGVYVQTGINLATFDFTGGVSSAEIGNNLHISGGFVRAYDGTALVEHGFHVWPDVIQASVTSTASGNVKRQQYYYVAVYEWTDSQGNVQRSAPSIPFGLLVAGSTDTNTVTVTVPTISLTEKSSVKVTVYRWATDQQVYYQVTTVASPLLNNPLVKTVQFVDTYSSASILGNSILYTTGGVLENIAAPATSIMSLYRSRLFLVDSEDPNLLWYSKIVIEATPVEFSDLQTIYVAPTISAQGNTGPITALSALDDKLIIWKKNAIFYIIGNGPDATGASNDYSEATFITATVGCANPNSIVFTPAGLMFQSDKGIWMLGRDLSTNYIGAPVEVFNNQTVTSAVTVPGTNQVRFCLDSGQVLLYDYFFEQWGTFSNVDAVSSCLFEDLHSYITPYGVVRQETPGLYLDDADPVLMSFTTAWVHIATLQGLQRAYYAQLLGTFLSPHQLIMQLGYDYNPPSQQLVVNPVNYNAAYGSGQYYGDVTPYGGPLPLEQYRLFFSQQKCEAFQISMQEQFDASYGTVAGAGLTLSGLNLVVGVKKGYTTTPAANSVG